MKFQFQTPKCNQLMANGVEHGKIRCGANAKGGCKNCGKGYCANHESIHLCEHDLIPVAAEQVARRTNVLKGGSSG